MIADNWKNETFEYMCELGHYMVSVPNARYISEASARITMWSEVQHSLLPQIQELVDDGWQMISEIGPGMLIIKRSSNWAPNIFAQIGTFTSLGDVWLLVGYSVKARKRIK